MTEQKKKTLITGSAALLAVLLAYGFRWIGKGSFYPTLFSYLRSFLYIGLFAAWVLSVRLRIVQKQTRMYLTSVSVLLILWMTSRTAKYFIFWQPAAIRYLWYLFYLPMLFVPMLAVLIALSLGKPDGYRLPKSTWILWAVSGVLLLLVLTNDLHQLVFTFPADAAVWSDTDNGYAAGYFRCDRLAGSLCGGGAGDDVFQMPCAQRQAAPVAGCADDCRHPLQRPVLPGGFLAAHGVRRHRGVSKPDVCADV